MDCYEKLANAVIIQAVKDYRAAYRKYLRNPEGSMEKSEVESMERFFRSSWFGVLTDADGEMILKRVKEMEHEKEAKRHEAGCING